MLDDELIVETPERVQLHYVLASLGNRFLAALIDHLIQLGSFIIVVAILAKLTSWQALSSMETWAAALAVIATFALYWGYFVFFETLWSGQTPGKRIMRLRVMREDGRPARFFEVMVRNILRLALDFMPPPSYAVGVLWMALSPRSKRLGDLVAGTVVVKERATEAPSLEDILKAMELNSTLTEGAPQMTFDLRRLGERELRAIETFLKRRYELPGPVRESSALRIATAISAKLGVPLDGFQPEAFLEEVNRQRYAKRRNRAEVS
jgi:uncharacterized RDD family membrane protein YckC